MHSAPRTAPAPWYRIVAALCLLLALLTTANAAAASDARSHPPLSATAASGSAERAHDGLHADAPHAENDPLPVAARETQPGERPSAPDHHATTPRTTAATLAAAVRAREPRTTTTSPSPPLHDRNRAPPAPPGI
ncbi:hypothetical protein ACFCYM_06650 [Streptomyces sp. NPDC056254]|uniref:hypothetical protein n=1 Tax=Streptomyces sp. NPDC056254 TaxID=3345763 RepID=UPI0035DF9CE4